MTPETKLPKVGTTIFTVMSQLALEHKAVNLGQGFPDFAVPQRLVDELDAAMRAGHNQYAPMAGCLPLRAAIAAKVEALYGTAYDVEHEITVTAGATQALFTAVTTCVHPGDEVIVPAPYWVSYADIAMVAGATPDESPPPVQFDDAPQAVEILASPAVSQTTSRRITVHARSIARRAHRLGGPT